MNIQDTLIEYMRKYPKKLEVRLIWSVPYRLEKWDMASMVQEKWRWN